MVIGVVAGAISGLETTTAASGCVTRVIVLSGSLFSSAGCAHSPVVPS